MTDEPVNIVPPPATQVKIQSPIWTRAAFVIAVVLLAITLFTFAAGSWYDRNEANNRAEQNSRVVRLEAECRSAPDAELLVVTSSIAGETAKLFYVLAQRADQTAFQPILDRLNELATQRDAAEAQLRVAIEECHQPT